MKTTSMRSTSYLLFWVLLLSCSLSLVLSMIKSSSSEEEESFDRRGSQLLPISIHSSFKKAIHEHGKEIRAPLSDQKYHQIYEKAISNYEDDIVTDAIQIVDQYGNFMTLPRVSVEDLVIEEEQEVIRAQKALLGLVGAIKDLSEKKYLVVSVFGHQSTGKSYTLNEVFGTNFAIKSGNMEQKTRGVWLARSSTVENLIVLDCEGTGGIEKLGETGIKAKIAELGMLYVMLTSNVAIFNLDKSQLTTQENAAILINTLSYYLKYRVPGSRPLRLIVTARNVDSGVKPSVLRKYALNLVQKAYLDNKEIVKGDFEDFFDFHFFWFGQWSQKRLTIKALEMGYEDPEFAEDDVDALFHPRMDHFKSKFQPGEHCYLNGLEPFEPASRLLPFLHHFWDLTHQMQGGALGNPLELLVESRLAETSKKMLHDHKDRVEEMILDNRKKMPDAALEGYKLFSKAALEKLPAELEEVVPSFAKLFAAHFIKEFIVTLEKIHEEAATGLMVALAKVSALRLETETSVLLAHKNRIQESEALSLVKACLEDIKKINAEARPEVWNTPLMDLKRSVKMRIKEQVAERIELAISKGAEHVKEDPSQYVHRIGTLAKNIAVQEGIEDEAEITKIENLIARTVSAVLDPPGRKQKILDNLNHHYRKGVHVAAMFDDNSHLNNAIIEANELKKHILGFRKHFHDRIPLHGDAEYWDQHMTEIIKDEEARRQEARDNEKAALESSSRESSLKYAMGGMMAYIVVTNYSLLNVLFLGAIYILAVGGLLGPQITDLSRWSSISSVFGLLWMSLSMILTHSLSIVNSLLAKKKQN